MEIILKAANNERALMNSQGFTQDHKNKYKKIIQTGINTFYGFLRKDLMICLMVH